MPRAKAAAAPPLLGHGQKYFLIPPNMPSLQWEDGPEVSSKSNCPTLVLICWALIKDKAKFFQIIRNSDFSVV